METHRIFDILDKYRFVHHNKSDALAAKEKGEWKKYTSADYVSFADNLSYGLIAMGFKKGDKIATISNNRPEWNFLDMAMCQAGLIHVPIYPTISSEEFKYILKHCEPSLIFVSDKTLYEKIAPIAKKILSVSAIYSFNKIDNVKNWIEIVELGKNNKPLCENLLEGIKDSIKPDDLATIIYTSGTTGNPKGVMLSHKNIISNVKSITQIFNFWDIHRTVSFLPISHIFERTINYFFQFKGLSIYYAENLGVIAENLREVKPHVIICVPRVLEKVYDKIIGKGKDLKGIKKTLFFWAVNLGLRFKFNRGNGWFYEFKLKIANKLIFSKWREALGNNIELIVVGGAALQPRLARVYNAAKITVVEGYGMTEASPVISANRMPETGDVRIGTVGPALPGVEVKIDDDGEILCRGENVMLGYYNEPKLTKEVIDNEGWLHTGDIGTMIEKKFVKITDRKKEIFKLSSGKYIAPQVIENMLKESFFIEQAMVVGENEKFASALISPNFSYLHNWCSSHHINYRDNMELIQNPHVIAQFQKEVNIVNKQLGTTDQIKRFRLVHEEWSMDTGELSPTLKVKRRFITQKYEDILKDIYSVQKTNGKH